MRASAKALAPVMRKAREEVKSSILADHRRLDALAGADEVDRPPVRCQGQALREVAGAVEDETMRDRHRRLTRIGAGVENVVPKTR